MKKQKLSIALLAIFLATGAHASFKQDVKLCLTVDGNPTNRPFSAKFESSDFFDTGNSTSGVPDGTACVSHIYNYGPKNIRLKVWGWSNHNYDVLIVPDWSCASMQSNGNFVISDYQGTNAKHEFWNLRISKAAPQDGWRYVYNLSCSHSSYD